MVVKDRVLEDVAKVLLKIKEQLNSSVLESSWGGWIYLGKSEIAFSTPSGPWDSKKYPGFLFKNEGSEFILRIVVGEKICFVLESITLASQLVNFNKSSVKLSKDGLIQFIDNYVMVVGVRKSKELVQRAMVEAGAIDNVITSFDQDKIDFQKIVGDILDWALLRERAKEAIKNSNMDDSKELDVLKPKKYWLYAPGEKAFLWDENIKRGEMTMGWNSIKDLSLFKSREEIQLALEKNILGETDKYVASLMLWNLVHKVSNGDIILVKKGNKKILGKGTVLSDYSYDSEQEYCNVRRVKWDTVGEWDVPKQQLPMQTLTCLSDKKYLPDLLALFDEGETVARPKESSLCAAPKNQILFGPPGTGKTYNTINKAIEIINPYFDLSQDRKEVKKEFDRLTNNGQIIFTTFHQSMSYEDFVEGIKPQEPKEEGQSISYAVEDGIFKRVCRIADQKSGNFESIIEKFKDEISDLEGKEPITIKSIRTAFDITYRGTSVFYVQPKASTKENAWYPVNIRHIEKVFETGDFSGVYRPTYVREIISFLENERGLKRGVNKAVKSKPYVLIIDEINRGNVSQIFGELITLIEEDKRLGQKESLEVILPYSKERFGVPSNLYILGTMNTADRSVEALDTALRRRFCFEEMPPKSELIASDGQWDVDTISADDVKDIMEIINRRVEKLMDKDHLIGHSYFLKVKNLDNLKVVFQNNILPLLQEYFYGDYGKIGLVIGEGFFEINREEEESLFADFQNYDPSMLMEKPVYRLKNITLMDNDEFIHALSLLLRRQIGSSVES